jgi:Ger(x)C family germination protein
MNERRPAIAILLILLSALAAGCAAPQMVDINRRVLGYAIGIDAGKEPGTVSLTLQYFSVTPSGGQDNKFGRSPVVVTVVADSVGAGWAKMRAQLPGELYEGSTEMIVLGRALADRGIRTTLDDLIRHPVIPLNADVVVARDTAQDLLTHVVESRDSPATYMIEMFAGAGKQRLDFWRLYDGALTPWRTTFAPVIEATDKGLNIAGYAIFQGDRLAQTLTSTEAGLLVASRGPRITDVELEPLRTKGGPITVRLPRIRIKARLNHDVSAAQVAVTGVGVLVEGPEVTISGEMDQQLQRHAATSIEQRVRTALEGLYADGIDVLNLSEQARRRMPDGRVPRDWPERTRHLQMQVHSTIKIMHGERGR